MGWIAIIAIIALNFLTAGFQKAGVFEDLPQAFASAEKGAQVGGSRDLFLVASGQRVLAADFAMVDMLVYYGTHHDHHEEKEEQSHYLDLFPMVKRVMALDPYFRQAIFYGSSALAFNEGREGQAVELLEQAHERDPKNWQYPLILTSIAYKKAGNFAKIAQSLAPVVELPDCPTMLKNILGNLYLKTGQREKAVTLFEKIVAEAPEEDYRKMALDKLERLGRR